MKNFLAVYVGSDAAFGKSEWSRLSNEMRAQREAAGMKAWKDWGAKHATSIVDGGTPLGKTKSASPHGISDIKNALVGYVIVRAESHEAAAKLFDNHPHFTIFPGDSVEIMECLPLPRA
jgi:hypothetical protein